MLSYLKSIRKFPLKLIPLAVCATILAAALSIYITIYESNRIDRITTKLDSNRVDIEWSLIESIILDEYSQVKKESKITALEIEYGLMNKYPDLDVLREQFNNEIYTTEFNNILHDRIEKDEPSSDSNLTFVGTHNHLITMFANTDSHILKDIDSEEVVNWSKISDKTPVPSLTDKAIRAILVKDDSIIFTFKDNPEFNDANYKPNISSIEKIYLKEGLEGLKNISLLAAAYITDAGDIFGTEDRTLLKENDNHKIIIVKAVNMEDVLDENKHRIENVMNSIDSLNDMTESQGERLVLQSILWSFILFLLSIFLIVIYNSEEKKGHLQGDRKGGK